MSEASEPESGHVVTHTHWDREWCYPLWQTCLDLLLDILDRDPGYRDFLLDKEIAISMDGRGRALDNVFIERLWWSVKYEEVYPKCYAGGHALHTGLGAYFDYYNNERRHNALDKRTPVEVFGEGAVRE